MSLVIMRDDVLAPAVFIHTIILASTRILSLKRFSTTPNPKILCVRDERSFFEAVRLIMR